MARKILVTGGTGFIGKHLVSRLVAGDCDVRVLTRSTADKNNGNEKAEYFSGNFLVRERIEAALNGVETVYHLAVTTTPGDSNDLILYDAQTNLMGTLNLIQAAVEAGVKRFIFVSSGGSVYGVSPHQPLPEDFLSHPISAHGLSKLTIEKYLEIFRRQFGMEYRVARASNPYGEGQDPEKGQGFIAYAMGRLAHGKEIVIWGDGTVVRDFFYIRDLIDALWLMHNDQGAYRVYNVGSGQGRSLNEIVEVLASITNQKVHVRHDAGRTADVPYNCLDISRIKTELGWEPRTNLITGLERSWRWIQSQIDLLEPVKL